MIKNYLKKIYETGLNIDEKNLNRIIKIIENKILKKKSIFICGNGGSAAIASHTLCDWMKRLFPLVSCNIYDLTSNKSLISAISNDVSFFEIFSYQLKITEFQIKKFGCPLELRPVRSVSAHPSQGYPRYWLRRVRWLPRSAGTVRRRAEDGKWGKT